MQTSWGPRIFWFCVFVLVVAAVFAWFYEPAPNPEIDATVSGFFHESPVTISSQLVGIELQIGLGDQEPTPWKGEIRPGKGKVLQTLLVQAAKLSTVDGGRFEVASFRNQKSVQPAILRSTLAMDSTDV